MKPTIFLSAVSDEFDALRDLLHQCFEQHFRVITQDKTLSENSGGNVRNCLSEAIDESDCIIHLTGRGFGRTATKPFPNHPDFQCSWTQFEYYYAHLKGKRVYAIVCGPALADSSFREEADVLEVTEKETLQRQHAARVVSGKFDDTPFILDRTLNNRNSHENLEDFLKTAARLCGELARHDVRHNTSYNQVKAELDALRVEQGRTGRFSRNTLLVVALSVLGFLLIGVTIWRRVDDWALSEAEARDTAVVDELRAEWAGRSPTVVGFPERIDLPENREMAGIIAEGWTREINLTEEDLGALRSALERADGNLDSRIGTKTVEELGQNLGKFRKEANDLREFGVEWTSRKRRAETQGLGGVVTMNELARFDARLDRFRHRPKDLLEEYKNLSRRLETAMKALLEGAPDEQGDSELAAALEKEASLVALLEKSVLLPRDTAEKFADTVGKARAEQQAGRLRQALELFKQAGSQVREASVERAVRHGLIVSTQYVMLVWNVGERYSGPAELLESQLKLDLKRMGVGFNPAQLSWQLHEMPAAGHEIYQEVFLPSVEEQWGKTGRQAVNVGYHVIHLIEGLRMEGTERNFSFSSKEKLLETLDTIQKDAGGAGLPESFLDSLEAIRKEAQDFAFDSEYKRTNSPTQKRLFEAAMSLLDQVQEFARPEPE